MVSVPSRSKQTGRRAVELSPGAALYHLGYAYYLAAAGRSGPATREAELALALDPLSPSLLVEVGHVSLLTGEPEQAGRLCEQALELDPKIGFAATCTVEARLLSGKVSPELVKRIAGVAGADTARLFSRMTSPAEWLRALQTWRVRTLEAQAESNPEGFGGYGWYEFAVAYARVGRHDDALVVLQRSASDRAVSFVSVAVDPRLAPLRTDQRFRALERRLGGTDCHRDPGGEWTCRTAG